MFPSQILNYLRFNLLPSPLSGALIFLLTAAWAVTGVAQTASVGFDIQGFQERFTLSAEKLLAEGKLKSLEALADARLQTEPLRLPPVNDKKLTPADLHDKMMDSTLVVGLYYHCQRCGQYHLESAAGFAVAEGGILTTCGHVLKLNPVEMKEAYPIAVDSSGTAYPIVEVVAFDPVADTCLLRAGGAKFAPLPMRAGSRVGDSLYCLSHPGQNFYMFTSGMVSRIQAEKRNNRTLRMVDVTCDYSPGSSGGPIVDSTGNVVAQVDTILPQLLPGADNKNPGAAATVYNLRTSIGSEEIMRLADPANRLPLPHPTPGDTQKADDVPAHGDNVKKSSTSEVFGVTSSYDLVDAASQIALDEKVKNFDELYALAGDKTQDFTVWSHDSKANRAMSLNTLDVGFTGVTGYYKPSQDSMKGAVTRGIQFEITYHDRKPDDTVTAHIAVNDTRASAKAADNKFNVEAAVKAKSFKLIKLGPPQNGRQVWLALLIEGFDSNVKAIQVSDLKIPVGQPVDIQFTAIDGREVDTAKMRGKVVLVDFWATWCGPCVQAAPLLAGLYDKYHEQGLEVIGVSLDQDRGALDKYLLENAHAWPQYFFAGTGANPLAARFGVNGIPAFLLLDKKGFATTVDIRNPDMDDLIKSKLQ